MLSPLSPAIMRPGTQMGFHMPPPKHPPGVTPPEDRTPRKFYAPTCVAVYGTLRNGQKMNSIMQGCRFMSQDRISGRLYDLGAFPAFKAGQTGIIHVDVFRLPIDNREARLTLGRLDYYESVGDRLFERIVCQAHVVSLPVWIYEFRGDVDEKHRISSGDWVKHMADKRSEAASL